MTEPTLLEMIEGGIQDSVLRTSLRLVFADQERLERENAALREALKWALPHARVGVLHVVNVYPANVQQLEAAEAVLLDTGENPK